MAGIISGENAHLQIGLSDTWGVSVAPQIELSFTSESLRYIPNYISEDALVGKKTTRRMDISGEKVTGDISVLVKPDEIGYLLKAALGSDTTDSADTGDTSSGDTAFVHTFTPVAAGASTTLPHFTAVVDRLVDTFGYISMKVNTFSLSAEPQDYLRMTFSLIGYDEDESDTIDSGLAASTLKALKFEDGAITVGGVAYGDVLSVSLNGSNGLEDNLYTLSSGANMAEIEPQEREFTGDMRVLFSTTTNATRTAKFKAGDTVAVVLTFTSSELIDAINYYKLVITMPICYITEADPVVDGPGRIEQTFRYKACESDSQEAITITLTNADATDYDPA